MERPKVGVGVIIVKDDKVLLHKRKNSHGNGAWGLAGGHLELNETLEECAKRETFEEVGIKIKNINFVTVTNDIFPESKHYITIFMLADYDSGEITLKEPEKSELWEWFSWKELPNPLFLPIQNLLKQGFDPFQNNKPKKYQHYKGNFYELVGEAKHSETHEEMVVYKALYDSDAQKSKISGTTDGGFGKNVVWVRPKEMFMENVIVDGKEVPRFKFVE